MTPPMWSKFAPLDVQMCVRLRRTPGPARAHQRQIPIETLLLACTLLAAGSHAQSLRPNTETAKPSVSGTVRDDGTGEPLRKAYLQLSRSGARDPKADDPDPVVVSDDKGQFRFKDLEPGDYYILVQKPEYADARVRDIHVTAEQGVVDVRVRMTHMGTISVRVLDPDGDPVPFSGIAFYRMTFEGGKRRLQAVQTLATNEFIVTTQSLEPGRYYIAASMWAGGNRKLPVSYLPTWYPSSIDAASASPVSLAPGQNISGLEIRLRPGATYAISGEVRGLPALRKGAQSYQISALRQSALAEEASQGAGIVGADGAFRIDGVIPGSYILQVLHFDTSRVPYANSLFGITSVQVGNENLTNVSVQATAPRRVPIDIEVEDDAQPDLSHLTFGLITIDGEFENMARQLDNGSYEVDGIGPGQRYTFHLWGGPDLNVYVKSVKAGGASFPDGVIDPEILGTNPLEVRLSTHGGIIRGAVTEGDGGASNAGGHLTVLLAPDTADTAKREREATEGSFDPSGAFTIRNIPPGKYILFAWRDLPADAWKDADFWREMRSEGASITVSENDVQQIRLPLITPDRTKALLDRLDIR